MEILKQCNRCQQTLLLSQFSRAKTCKDGHRNYCKECQSSAKKDWYANNKEHVLTKAKLWHQNHPERIREIQNNWSIKNPDYRIEYKKQYLKENRAKINAQTAARRKRVQQNTPSWANRQLIVDFYLNCPKGYHVDHIIPLRGKTVSGLHVIENLQYLLAEENLSKGNKLALHA